MGGMVSVRLSRSGIWSKKLKKRYVTVTSYDRQETINACQSLACGPHVSLSIEWQWNWSPQCLKVPRSLANVIKLTRVIIDACCTYFNVVNFGAIILEPMTLLLLQLVVKLNVLPLTTFMYDQEWSQGFHSDGTGGSVEGRLSPLPSMRVWGFVS